MLDILSVIDIRFVFLVFIGSFAGLFVGAIPGLSVSMATALLVSITYTWSTGDALATIMGVYVVGVFSGAVSAILINIPGAPSSIVTTIDGYPMAKRGEAHKALYHTTIHSFIGSVFGLVALWLMARPVSLLARNFNSIDYFLLALFGISTVGSTTSKSYTKGLIAASLGIFVSLIGQDPMVGTARLTFGVKNLQAGIDTIPALVGLFGFAEVLSVVSESNLSQSVAQMKQMKMKIKDTLKYWKISLYSALLGTGIGALPGAGGPVASFIAYNEVKRITKNPEVPFGEGAVEGIVASESSNNACIGGALIPMLTLAIPGDAVTAIMLSVFYVHGLRPGYRFLEETPELFYTILAGGFIACICLLILGLLVAPKISKVITIPKMILIPVVAVLCVVGSFASNNRIFDVGIMFVFGFIGFLMKKRGYPIAPMVLGIVLGGMMDRYFRMAISTASSRDNFLMAMFGRPITIILLIVTLGMLFSPILKKAYASFKLKLAK